MLKYFLAFVFFLGMAIFVARQDERSAQESAQKAKNLASAAISAKSDTEHPQKNIDDTERNSPGWRSFFRWPNGTTAWAIVLTLLAVAEQAKETAKAAKAAEKSAKATEDSIPHQAKAADAALVNAQALINAERALIDIELMEEDITKSYTLYWMRAINYGKTPAIITEAALGRGYWAAIGDIPLNGSIGTTPAPDVRAPLCSIVPPDQKLVDIAKFDISQFDAGADGRIVTYHGHISYRDIFGQDYRTEVVYLLRGAPLSTSSDWQYSDLVCLSEYTRYLTTKKIGEQNPN